MSEERTEFDIDAERGTQGELFVRSIRDALATKSATIEVKSDAYFFSASAASYHTVRFYIERECYSKRDGQYHPSGIEITKSYLWAVVCGKHPALLCFETAWMKRAVALAEKKPGNAGKANDGKGNPTRGTYVYMNHLLQARDTSKDEH